MEPESLALTLRDSVLYKGRRIFPRLAMRQSKNDPSKFFLNKVIVLTPSSSEELTLVMKNGYINLDDGTRLRMAFRGIAATGIMDTEKHYEWTPFSFEGSRTIHKILTATDNPEGWGSLEDLVPIANKIHLIFDEESNAAKKIHTDKYHSDADSEREEARMAARRKREKNKNPAQTPLLHRTTDESTSDTTPAEKSYGNRPGLKRQIFSDRDERSSLAGRRPYYSRTRRSRRASRRRSRSRSPSPDGRYRYYKENRERYRSRSPRDGYSSRSRRREDSRERYERHYREYRSPTPYHRERSPYERRRARSPANRYSNRSPDRHWQEHDYKSPANWRPPYGLPQSHQQPTPATGSGPNPGYSLPLQPFQK